MIKALYTKSQLGFLLHRTIEFQHQEFNKPKPNVKAEWLKKTSAAILETLEVETKKFNYLNPENTINAKDLISALQVTLHRILKAMEKYNGKQ